MLSTWTRSYNTPYALDLTIAPPLSGGFIEEANSVLRRLLYLKPLKRSSVLLSRGSLTVRLAKRSDLEQIYKLRYDCFYKEYLNLADEASGFDVNRYDLFANYLVLTDGKDVVGTYRLMTGSKQKHFSFSETFDCKDFAAINSPVVELSRACVAKPYRTGAPILLMWRGLAAYLRELGAQTLVGRVSMPGDDPAKVRALYRHLKDKGDHRSDLNVFARKPIGEGDVAEFSPDVMPPLLRSYIRLGAKVAGDSCYDPILRCFDIFTILDMQHLSDKFS